MRPLWIVLLVAAIALGLGAQVPIGMPGTTVQIPSELAAPSAPELNAGDARKMLEAQRTQQWRQAQYQQKLRETLESEKALQQADRDVDVLLAALKRKYDCQYCDLLWDLTWAPPVGVKFSTPTPEE